MSAKIASPLLNMVDFSSRNPVHCSSDACTICADSSYPDVTFFGKANVLDPSTDLPEVETPLSIWKEIQMSSPHLKRAAALLESGKSPSK